MQASTDKGPQSGPFGRQDPTLPQVFGRYLLIQRLSRGGMGEIFLAKHGLAGLTKTIALEVATHGITANCISPVVICPTVAASAMASSFLRPNVTFSIIETKQSHRKFAISLYHRMAGFHAVNFGSYGEE